VISTTTLPSVGLPQRDSRCKAEDSLRGTAARSPGPRRSRHHQGGRSMAKSSPASTRWRATRHTGRRPRTTSAPPDPSSPPTPSRWQHPGDVPHRVDLPRRTRYRPHDDVPDHRRQLARPRVGPLTTLAHPTALEKGGDRDGGGSFRTPVPEGAAHHRIPGLPGPPAGQHCFAHAIPVLDSARRMQRKPRCDVEVSTACGIRAAGRYRWQ